MLRQSNRGHDLVLWASFALGVGGMALWMTGALSGEQISIWWGAAIAIGGLAATFTADEPFDVFSAGFAFNFIMAVQYGIPLLYLPGFIEDSSITLFDRAAPHLSTSGAVTFWFWLLFNVGYRSRRVAQAGQRFPLFGFAGSEASLKLLWLVLTAMHLVGVVAFIRADQFLQSSAGGGGAIYLSFFGLLQFTGSIAAGIAGVAAIRARLRDPVWNVMLAYGMAVGLLLGLASGSKLLALTPFILVLMFLNYGWRLLPRRHAAAALAVLPVLFFLLFPLNSVYRDMSIQTGITESQSLGTSLALLGDAAVTVAGMAPAERETLAQDYVRVRMANITISSEILAWLEAGGDLRLGETYFRTFLAMVPRPLWPDKPLITLGAEITHVIYERNSADTTSTGVTAIGEAIYNFGPLVAPLVGLLYGWMYRFLYDSFRAGMFVNPVMATALHIYLWFWLYYYILEGNFAAAVTGALKGFILVFALAFVLGIRPFVRARSAEPAPVREAAAAAE